MLSPGDRAMFLDALRPPDGYRLDWAIGTTYTLDLMALLTAPVAFAFSDWQDAEGRPTKDPMALLRAVREYASRMVLFCQSGQIAVPGRYQQLYGYLEDTVVQVRAPHGGSFHAKVWILRHLAPDEPPAYRVLCMSRNLTFDRSWDTLLVLDGRLRDRDRSIRASQPLADFVKALSGMTQPVLAGEVRTRIDAIADELRRVAFEPPEPFEDLVFWPIGLDRPDPWPFRDRIDRLLVISPFVDAGCLDRLADTCDDRRLVSRLECLSALPPERLKGLKRIWTFNPQADPEPQDTEGREIGAVPLSGLHAKLYVADAGWQGRVWTGSANATGAAFERNVELLVELTGKKSRCGIDAMLERSKGTTSFVDLLQPFSPGAAPVEEDPVQRRLEQAADAAATLLAGADLAAVVLTEEVSELFRVELHARRPISLPPAPEISVRCWPITSSDAGAVTLPSTGTAMLAQFRRLSFEGLTPFYAFEVIAREKERSHSSRFVLKVALEGAPPNRHERILRSLLTNRSQVLRFLLLLLSNQAGTGTGLLDGDGDTQGDHGDGAVGVFTDSALLESMVRALDHDPTRLDQIAAVIDDLRATPEGRDLLPIEFDAIWGPIWAMRQQTKADRP
jgi:hypothetical protein